MHTHRLLYHNNIQTPVPEGLGWGEKMYIHLDVTFTDLIFYLAFSVNIYLSLSSGNFFNVWTSRCNFHQGNWCIEARLCSLWSTSLSIKWNNETSQLPSFQHCFLSENFSLLTICGINIANELLEFFFPFSSLSLLAIHKVVFQSFGTSPLSSLLWCQNTLRADKW